MKQLKGIWLPDNDTHFEAHLGPMVGGKATYQLRKYDAAMKHIERRRHAVDVGAHVGLWSRLMALDFNRVTAFEPLKTHRECYVRNVPDALLLAYAVGSRPGMVRVKMPNDNTGSAHVGSEGEQCEVVTLDSLGLVSVDFLKIDVEGYEHDVTLGAEETIRRDNPVIVVEQKPGHAERYGRGRHDAVNLLTAWGMKEAEVISGDHIMVW